MASTVCMRQGVAEVLRMKRILDHESSSNGGDGSDASIVYESLMRLRDMGLSVKTLEATGIGKSVRVLQKHASKDVRQTASTLMKAWKAMVSEWFDATQQKSVSSSKLATPKASVEARKSNTCNQPKKMVLKTERKPGVLETESIPKGPMATQKKSVSSSKLATPKASVEAGKSNTCNQPKKVFKTERKSGPVAPAQPRKALTLEEQEEKFKETKRKMQQGYEKAENIKRQRKIRVMEVHEVMEHRLLPQTRAMNGKRKWGHTDGRRRAMAFF